MASEIKRGESLFIPFRNEKSIYDSQCKPRMYKTQQAFEKSFPGYRFGIDDVELVEYAEVERGLWEAAGFDGRGDYKECCSNCKSWSIGEDKLYCPVCGAKMG